MKKKEKKEMLIYKSNNECVCVCVCVYLSIGRSTSMSQPVPTVKIPSLNHKKTRMQNKHLYTYSFLPTYKDG